MSDFTDRYNTILSPEDEKRFKLEMASRLGDLYDYDLRGAWLELNSGKMQPDERGHLGDKYKKPNHPTFSDQSIYNGVDGYYGGSWYESPEGLVSYFAGMRNDVSPDRLKAYFDRYEKDVRLIDPRTVLYK